MQRNQEIPLPRVYSPRSETSMTVMTGDDGQPPKFALMALSCL